MLLGECHSSECHFTDFILMMSILLSCHCANCRSAECKLTQCLGAILSKYNEPLVQFFEEYRKKGLRVRRRTTFRRVTRPDRCTRWSPSGPGPPSLTHCYETFYVCNLLMFQIKCLSLASLFSLECSTLV